MRAFLPEVKTLAPCTEREIQSQMNLPPLGDCSSVCVCVCHTAYNALINRHDANRKCSETRRGVVQICHEGIGIIHSVNGDGYREVRRNYLLLTHFTSSSWNLVKYRRCLLYMTHIVIVIAITLQYCKIAELVNFACFH